MKKIFQLYNLSKRVLPIFDGELAIVIPQSCIFFILSCAPPLPPEIIDVNASYEGELPGQQGLPSERKRLPFEPELEQLKNSTLEEFTIFDYD